MSQDFVSAMMNWRKEQEKYVSDNLTGSKSGLAPRKTILITVPVEFEQSVKDFAKAKRKEADAGFSGIAERERMELAIKFEETSPPPSRNNF